MTILKYKCLLESSLLLINFLATAFTAAICTVTKIVLKTQGFNGSGNE